MDTANILKKNLGEKAAKVPTKEIPNWLIRLLAVFNPKLKMIMPLLGSVKHASNEKEKKLLGWKPRSIEEAILATANSLIDLKIVNV